MTTDNGRTTTVGAYKKDATKIHALKDKLEVTTQPDVVRELVRSYERTNGPIGV